MFNAHTHGKMCGSASFPESWSITMDDIGARASLGAGATDEDSGKRGKGYST